jgi:hypothetical protein
MAKFESNPPPPQTSLEFYHHANPLSCALDIILCCVLCACVCVCGGGG